MQEENKVGLTGLASALFGGDEEHETLSGGARQSGVRVRQLSARRQERRSRKYDTDRWTQRRRRHPLSARKEEKKVTGARECQAKKHGQRILCERWDLGTRPSIGLKERRKKENRHAKGLKGKRKKENNSLVFALGGGLAK